MMTFRQFYLLKLIEECQEVSHRAAKSMQFGAHQIQIGHERTNAQRLTDEIVDLKAVIGLMENTLDVEYRDWPTQLKQMADKGDKIAKYLKFSQELGLVEGPTDLYIATGEPHD